MRSGLIWAFLASALAAPLIAGMFSPLLAWRQPVYIIAGFGGIVAMVLMVLQPLAVLNALPEVSRANARRLHKWAGAGLLVAVLIHVGGLWVTSPPDVIDALTFTSPTPFSAWGVIAMWALISAGLLAALRRRSRLRWQTWRRGHSALTFLSVLCTVVHVVLIEGTMEPVSKALLSIGLVGATSFAMFSLRIWRFS